MKDLQREIVSQVAAGTITAEEGAARLQSLDDVQPVVPDRSRAAGPPAAPGAPDTRRIKVISQVGSAEIVGDASVAYVVADGPHTARQEGDTMVICQAPFDESAHFTFGRGERRTVVNGIEVPRKLTVRMNPSLALYASVQAGSVRIDGVHGPIDGEVQAGNCQVSGLRGPLNFIIQMGNLSASGRLDRGASKVRCEMGSVKIHLEAGSSVRVTGRTTLGKLSIEGESPDKLNLGQSSKEVTIGSGEGTLDVECTMGNVRVSAE